MGYLFTLWAGDIDQSLQVLVGLLLSALSAGDISRWLRVHWHSAANAGSTTLTATVGGSTQTCLSTSVYCIIVLDFI